MGTTHVGEDDASSQGLSQRLLSPGSSRPAFVQGENSTTSPRASGDDNDSTVEDTGPEIQDNDDEDDGDYGMGPMGYLFWGPRITWSPRTRKFSRPMTTYTPQEAGGRLLMGGEFGRIGVEARSRKSSANFSKAILSSRSKLRQTHKQDITNVRVLYYAL